MSNIGNKITVSNKIKIKRPKTLFKKAINYKKNISKSVTFSNTNSLKESGDISLSINSPRSSSPGSVNVSIDKDS